MEFYIKVDNINELWDSVKEKLKSLNIKEPFIQKYGMKEFHIEIPQTNTLLFVGHKV